MQLPSKGIRPAARFRIGVAMTFAATAFAAGLSFRTPAFAADITGAGATFPYPIYARWAADYKAETGNGLNYQSIGSGAGIRQILARTVTFGASDRPMKQDQLDKNGLVQWPQVMGALVVVYNLEGIKAGELVLDGPTLADIYLGKIRYWNDAAIARLNAGLTLPATGITVVRRSDGSGTTFLFTDYLSKVSEEWKNGPGAGTAVEWPTGVGARGNEGVAANVIQTRNAIGYVEYAVAAHVKMTYSSLVNRDGKTVQPVVASFQAAADNADWSQPGFYQVLTNQPGANSWPITGASFILMHRQPARPEDSVAALKFFDWTFDKGGKAAEELHYIPMPERVIALIRAAWKKDITGVER